MCGIFGYVGKRNAFDIGLRGIKDLEYRGYDSAGMALMGQGGAIEVVRAKGKLDDLRAKLAGRDWRGTASLWHTRWATHGEPSEQNAHPHGDCRGRIFVVHNGIIENHEEIKARLISHGHNFRSDTDTEVLPHLIEEYYRGDLAQALRKALVHVSGTYGMVAMSRDEPDVFVAARMASPLVIGIGEDERFIASDAAAILPHTREVVYLDDGDVAVIRPNRHEITDSFSRPVEKTAETLDWAIEETGNGRFSHRMLREIHEQPEAIENSLRGRIVLDEGDVKLGGLAAVEDKLRGLEQITIVACGTAYHAGMIGKMLIEEFAGIPTNVEFASEFVNREKVILPRSAVLAISQSGETMDTLLAVKEAKAYGLLTLGIINRVGSLIARSTDAGIYNHIGPETAVASTKAFVSQIAILTLLAVHLGRKRRMSRVAAQSVLSALQKAPTLVEEAVKSDAAIRELAERHLGSQNFLYLGRGYQYPIALEGALKLKEISYVHAEDYPAGEMKHGPLALIDENFPTMAICLKDAWQKKMVSNVEEIRTRRGPVIAVVDSEDSAITKTANHVIRIPPAPHFLAPIITAIPLQLFAYHMGVLRGIDVDRPRNLAKSVTVE